MADWEWLSVTHLSCTSSAVMAEVCGSTITRQQNTKRIKLTMMHGWIRPIFSCKLIAWLGTYVNLVRRKSLKLIHIDQWKPSPHRHGCDSFIISCYKYRLRFMVDTITKTDNNTGACMIYVTQMFSVCFCCVVLSVPFWYFKFDTFHNVM